MSPIDPKRLAAPMLLGGPDAAGVRARSAASLGFTGTEVYADTVGSGRGDQAVPLGGGQGPGGAC